MQHLPSAVFLVEIVRLAHHEGRILTAVLVHGLIFFRIDLASHLLGASPPFHRVRLLVAVSSKQKYSGW